MRMLFVLLGVFIGLLIAVAVRWILSIKDLKEEERKIRKWRRKLHGRK